MGERRFNKKHKLSFDIEECEPKTMGGRIRYWRRKTGMTQENLAEGMNLSKQTISFYENDVTDVKASKLVDIAETLGIEVGWLFADQFAEKFAELNNEGISQLDDKEMCSIYHSLSSELQSVAAEQMRCLLNFYESQKKH
ncbi:helix-turn-helix domain-containing protein [Oribacterium sp. WCC10]|uniref:helix-turn-helix domain-containing protein n=1 Tax=Oribacterium sp. WCC10 TaxID=1855343 RepID=UPI0008E1EBFF|nr:helix-turn-helix transcriptional regulator [Oribacterium sp. WCC10]SFG58899.1 Helix-turn-helix [Oribacterium sp. WCC10]